MDPWTVQWTVKRSTDGVVADIGDKNNTLSTNCLDIGGKYKGLAPV